MSRETLEKIDVVNAHLSRQYLFFGLPWSQRRARFSQRHRVSSLTRQHAVSIWATLIGWQYTVCVCKCVCVLSEVTCMCACSVGVCLSYRGQSPPPPLLNIWAGAYLFVQHQIEWIRRVVTGACTLWNSPFSQTDVRGMFLFMKL